MSHMTGMRLGPKRRVSIVLPGRFRRAPRQVLPHATCRLWPAPRAGILRAQVAPARMPDSDGLLHAARFVRFLSAGWVVNPGRLLLCGTR